MIQAPNQTNSQVQVTSARPDGWSLQDLLVRGAIVFLTIVLFIAGAFLVISLALGRADCCFDQGGTQCTTPENCYCFGPNVSIGEGGAYVGEVRPCPVGGPELCTLDTACYFPPELFPLWGSRTKGYYKSPSGTKLPCT